MVISLDQIISREYADGIRERLLNHFRNEYDILIAGKGCKVNVYSDEDFKAIEIEKVQQDLNELMDENQR